MWNLAIPCIVWLIAADGVPAQADPDNTLASGMWVFQGTLTPRGKGYSGTLWAIDEVGTGYGDGISGFDVYAKDGAWATYETGSGYTEGRISGHDAYKVGNGWGSNSDPDCSDWNNYQLNLTETTWAIEYNDDVGIDHDTTGAICAPMSGTMDWMLGVATETGTGAYYFGKNASRDFGYCAMYAAGKGQSTAGAWDMDWSWGSDYVPLQTPHFIVTVHYVDGGISTVEMRPISEPAMTMVLLGPGSLAIVLSIRRVQKRREAADTMSGRDFQGS